MWPRAKKGMETMEICLSNAVGHYGGGTMDCVVKWRDNAIL